MSIDISRKRFEARKAYGGVVMQQGRVQLDADWNEEVAIRDRRTRSGTFDVLGPCAVPATTPDAFRIEATGGTLTIGPGRMYVDGIQAENHGGDPRDWNRHLAEDVGTSAIPYGHQPYLPDADSEAPLPAGPGPHLVYLDVWEREVNHLVDPDLVENAVGVDTTARTQTVWQVKVLADVGDVGCSTPGEDVPGWTEATAPSAGRLTTGALAIPADPDPCLLPPGGGYKGLENHTYRVEIHAGGAPLEPGDPSDPLPAGTATFKWSRDNGTVAAEVVALPALDRVRVSTLGRDEFLRFRDGDWVEVTDNVRELHGRAGFLSRITVDEAHSELVLEMPLPAGTFPVDPADDATDPERRTRVRRWDQSGVVEDTSGNDIVDLNAAGATGAIPVPPAGTPIQLEAGVVVTFETPSGGVMRTGDHWIFVARTADASVEELDRAPPAGIHHHYCRLAVVHLPDDGDPEVTDCRHPWGCDCCCEISVAPGQDVQDAIDALPPRGGKVCLEVGVHRLRRPLVIAGRTGVVLEGCGRGSMLVLERDGGDFAAAIHVAGASRDIAVRDLSAWSDGIHHLVAVHDASARMTVADVLLANVSDRGGADCVFLGGCADVSVERSVLVGRRGVAQGAGAELGALVDEVGGSAPGGGPGTEPETGPGAGPGDMVAAGSEAAGGGGGGAGGDDVGPVMVAQPPGSAGSPAVTGTVLDLRLAGNLILASEHGITLQDVWRGVIAENRIGTVLDRMDDLRRSEEAPGPNGSEPPNGRPGPQEDPFFAALHRALGELAWEEPGAEDLDGLATGIEACLLEAVAIRDNRIRAATGCRLHYGRGASLTGNDIQATATGLSTAYAFDLVAEANRIEVAPAEEQTPEQDRRIDFRALGSPDPGAAAVALSFTGGARILRNDLHAPSGIVARRGGRSTCPQASGRSLLRVLRVEKLWRVVVELGWIILQIVRMLNPATGGPATREALEADLLTRWVGFLAGGLVPAFLGKATVERNNLCVDRYGILARQIFTLGGLAVAGNRVAGARYCGIEIRPLFSVGLVDRFSAWIRCVLEAVIRFLRLFHRALGRFLDGQAAPGVQPGADAVTQISATVISGFLTLCARFCDHPGREDDEEEEDRVRPTPDRLRDALGDLLDGTCWVEDLLGGAYRISANDVRGSGTGIWAGIDGTRVDDNRVTVDFADSLAWETVTLGLLLARGEQDAASRAMSAALVDLDRDFLLFALANAETPISAPPSLSNLIAEFSGLVAPDSPLRHWVDELEGAVSDDGDPDPAWRNLLAVIWGELRGYGIVLAGGNFCCSGNHVHAEEVCFGARLAHPTFRQERGGRPTAVGGIWHVSNLAGLMADVLGLVAEDRNREELLLHLVIAQLHLFALHRETDRELEVRDSRIRRALIHGISARSVLGLKLVDLNDNHVLDAGRIGVLFRGTSSTVRAHRNAVRRTHDVYGFFDRDALPPDFSRLMDILSMLGSGSLNRSDTISEAIGPDSLGASAALVSGTHGEARHLPGRRTSAVRVHARSVGVTGNHVLTDSAFALEVQALVGLFTHNLSNQQNLVPFAIEEAPNRTNL